MSFPYPTFLLRCVLMVAVAVAGCAGPADPAASTGAGSATVTGAATASPAGAVPRRLLVLRLGGAAPEVLRSQGLAPAPARAQRPRPAGWDGRYSVLDGRGRTLATGAFRIPRRRHALFGDVGGAAGPVSAPLARPVIWLRVETPPGATRLRLSDRALGRDLGEVAL